MSELRRYPDYKDSGVPWLGEIPSHWEVIDNKFIFSFSRGLTITKSNLVDEGIPCINYGEVHSKYGFEVDPKIHKLKCVPKEYVEIFDYALLNRGDFIFADTSEDYKGSGNFTYLNSDEVTFAGYHTVVARLKTDDNPRFIAYLFDSNEFRTQVKTRVSGVKVFSITHSILKNVSVWIPPKDEQQAIVNFLDNELERIDTLISKQQQLIEKLAEQRSAVITHAVTKGLNPDVAMKDSGVEWLGEIPEDWIISRFKDITSYFKGYAFKSSDFSDTEGAPLVKASNLKKGFIVKVNTFIPEDKILENHAKVKLLKNDIILSTVGSLPSVKNSAVGQIAIVDNEFDEAYLNQNNVCFRLDSEMDADYYGYFVKSSYFRRSLDMLALWIANQAYLEVKNLNDIPVSVPPIETQKMIKKFLDKETQKIDQISDATSNIIAKLQEYRSALITQAVTGKIDVRHINKKAS